MPIEDIREALHAALAHLAGSDTDYAQTRNAIGFSKIDAPLGHSLAGTDPAIWSPAQTHAAWRIARRYAGTQLTMFDVDAIPEPEQPEIAAARTRNVPGSPVRTYPPTRVFLLGDHVAISWPYGEPDFYDKMDRVKAVPGRKWNPDDKVWTLPANEAALTALADMASDYADAPSRFVIDDDAATALDRIGETLTKTVQASHAAASEYNASGLRPEENLLRYQRAGVEFGVTNKRYINADEPGLGKTCESIGVAADQSAWPILIICPPNLELNWQKELRKWVDPGGRPLRIQIASGITRCRIDPDIDVLIIHSDIFYAWKKAIVAVRWGCVIADESHCFKGKSQRTQTMKDVIKEVQPEYVQFLTGTPVLSRPIEIWNLIEMTGKAHVFGGWKQYALRYCEYKERFIRGKNGKPGRTIIDVSGAANTEELNRILRSSGIMIRRLKKDVLSELPPRRWATVPLEMSPASVKAYDQAAASLAAFVAEKKSREAEREAAWRLEGEITWEAEDTYREDYADHPDVVGTTREQFVTRYVEGMRDYFAEEEELRLAENEQLIRFEALKQIAFEAKREAAFAWIDSFLESGQKLVVFAHHREVVLEVAARYNAPTIIGGQSAVSVEAGKEKFQNDPECRVIACNIKSGGTGHTLTAASDVCFLELAWTPGDMDQCLDRSHRLGQKNSVTGWVLVAARSDGGETIDGEVAALLERKRAVVDSATDGAGELAQVSILKELSERIGQRR